MMEELVKAYKTAYKSWMEAQDALSTDPECIELVERVADAQLKCAEAEQDLLAAARS